MSIRSYNDRDADILNLVVQLVACASFAGLLGIAIPVIGLPAKVLAAVCTLAYLVIFVRLVATSKHNMGNKLLVLCIWILSGVPILWFLLSPETWMSNKVARDSFILRLPYYTFPLLAFQFHLRHSFVASCSCMKRLIVLGIIAIGIITWSANLNLGLGRVVIYNSFFLTAFFASRSTQGIGSCLVYVFGILLFAATSVLCRSRSLFLLFIGLTLLSVVLSPNRTTAVFSRQIAGRVFLAAGFFVAVFLVRDFVIAGFRNISADYENLYTMSELIDKFKFDTLFSGGRVDIYNWKGNSRSVEYSETLDAMKVRPGSFVWGVGPHYYFSSRQWDPADKALHFQERNSVESGLLTEYFRWGLLFAVPFSLIVCMTVYRGLRLATLDNSYLFFTGFVIIRILIAIPMGLFSFHVCDLFFWLSVAHINRPVGLVTQQDQAGTLQLISGSRVAR